MLLSRCAAEKHLWLRDDSTGQRNGFRATYNLPLGLSRCPYAYGEPCSTHLHNGIPFDVRIPSQKPVAAGALSRAELDAELMKGVESLKAGKGYSADEVDAMLQKEFGI